MLNKNEILKLYSDQVQDIKDSGLFKGELIMSTPQNAHVELENGPKLLCMCSNNYLGLGDNPRIIEAAKRTYDERGYGLASVRFICGTQDIHKELEKTISEFLQTEDTILYSSCFDANGGLFETILTAEDAVISDELNHASIIDGIRLCKNITNKLSENFVLTPHLKEMSYLTGRTVIELAEGIVSATLDAAMDMDCIVVGKDARTIVSDGSTCYINVSGNNGMATGGSGDVLAGLIAGFLGQGSDPYEAAKLGVYLHGLAGDLMAEKMSRYSMLASDILEGIGEVITEVSNHVR